MMKFDVLESRGPVNELAAFVRSQGKWDYFVTITANNKETPNLAPIYRAAIRVASGRDVKWNEEHTVYVGQMTVLLQAWYRYVRYFWQWIAHSPDKPMGNVKAYWYR